MAPPSSRHKRTISPPLQQVIPRFSPLFQAERPFFYFLHKIDPQKATLTVEVIGANLTYTFNHSRVLQSDKFKLSEVASSLERKTVGFLAVVKSPDDRQVLAWAESGHGLGRSGDLLDAPAGSPVLASELWTRRVIHVGKILGIRMRRSFDNQNNTVPPSLDIDGIFQGSHVEVKLAVHGIWVMLDTFNITKDLDNVTKEDLKKLRDVTWADGTRPVFEVYFSRKNCPPCGNIVRGLSELTGIEIKLLWKHRVTLMQYYKAPKSKEQAKRQKKAFIMQRDVADFDDVVARRAEHNLDCPTDDCTIISYSDTSIILDDDGESDLIIIDDDEHTQQQTTWLSNAETIDLTKNEVGKPSAAPTESDEQLSKTMQERQQFMEEMERYSLKANSSPAPDSSRRPEGHQDKPPRVDGMRQQMRHEIRKPLPASSVEVKFVSASQWEDGGSRHRRRFLLRDTPGVEEVRSVSPRRPERGGKWGRFRRRGTSRFGGPVRSSPCGNASSTAHYNHRYPHSSVTGSGSPLRTVSAPVVDLSLEASGAIAPVTPENRATAQNQSPRAEAPTAGRRAAAHTLTQTSSSSDLGCQAAKSPTRILFPRGQLPAIDLSQATFPSPKPAPNARPNDAPQPVHHPTPQLKRSRAENAQKTEVFHYPTPHASSAARPLGQHATPNNRVRPWLSDTPKAQPQMTFAYRDPSSARSHQAFENERRGSKRPKLAGSHLDTPKHVQAMSLSSADDDASKGGPGFVTPNRRRMGRDV